MKKSLNYIAFLLLASFVFVSCDYEENNYESLIGEPNPNATYYIQFANASRSITSTVDLEGEIEDIETTVDVVLLGVPRTEDVTVNLTVDPSSTLEPNMYELAATSVTIPAGETSGSVSLVTNTEEMPSGVPLTLKLNIDAGDNTATAGTNLVYELTRLAFCPLENDPADLTGSYTVTENVDGYENAIVVTEDGEDLVVAGIGQTFINDFWAETVTGGGTFTMEVTRNGNLVIPRQYLFTTDYQGDAYDYEIEGTGFWTNCGDKPTLEIIYDIYYPGDADGLMKTYGGLPNLRGIWTQD